MGFTPPPRVERGYPAGTLYTGSVVYNVVIWWETLDLTRLIGQIAESCKYSGSWPIGAELSRVRGRRSSVWVPTSATQTSQPLQAERPHASSLSSPAAWSPLSSRPQFGDIGSEQALKELQKDPNAIGLTTDGRNLRPCMSAIRGEDPRRPTGAPGRASAAEGLVVRGCGGLTVRGTAPKTPWLLETQFAVQDGAA